MIQVRGANQVTVTWSWNYCQECRLFLLDLFSCVGGLGMRLTNRWINEWMKNPWLIIITITYHQKHAETLVSMTNGCGQHWPIECVAQLSENWPHPQQQSTVIHYVWQEKWEDWADNHTHHIHLLPLTAEKIIRTWNKYKDYFSLYRELHVDNIGYQLLLSIN